MDTPHQREVMRLAIEHRSQIWGMLMGLCKHPQRAEDLFQETYLVICEKWQQFELGTNFLAWARAIARFQYLASIDPQRRRAVAVEADVLEAALARVEKAPEERGAEREALALCLASLPHRGRDAIGLRYGDGLPCDEIAPRLGMSVGALYVLLSRTRQKLQRCIEKRIRGERPLHG